MAGSAARGCFCKVKSGNNLNTKHFSLSFSEFQKFYGSQRSLWSTGILLDQQNGREKSPKKRDRLTVLKALASTVGEVPDRPDSRFFDDVILNARTSIKNRELTLAIESGTKAAEYVLEQYPDLIQLRKPVPAWPETERLPQEVEPTVENLKLLMKRNDKVPQIIEIYGNLNSSGDLSLDLKNEVLAFSSYHSLPSSPDMASQVDPETSSSSSSSSSSDDEGQSVSATERPMTTWRNDGLAEKLFEEMKDQRNAQSYEVFILGLIKHCEFIRAYYLFREFQEKEFKGSRYFYETLIKNVINVRENDQDRWDLVEEIVASMNTAVKPTSVTFATLMSVALEQQSNVSERCQRLFGEMKKMKIVPSLGCLYHLLAAERREFENQQNYNQNIRVLYICVEEIQAGRVNLELTHPSDVEFFHIAMHLARFKRVGEVAEKIFDLMNHHKLNHMLGSRAKTFYGNFLAAIARSPKDMETVFNHYERIVPSYLIPHDWVYEQLFFASRNNNDISYVPRFYKDMSKFNVYIMNKKLLPALYLALELPIPEGNEEEFLKIVEKSKFAIENLDITPEVRQAMIATAVNIYCLNGKTNEAMELLKHHQSLETTPTYKSLLNILETNVKQADKLSAMHTLKYMSSLEFTYDSSLEEVIEKSFLAHDKERIASWFQAEEI